jgi:uncharacterized damage-inducible protein DinB
MFESSSNYTARAALGVCALAALLLLPSAVVAQAPAGVEGARSVHEMVRGYVMATATSTDEELYAFRPTEEVRSLGELLGHIGNASFAFCSTALDEPSPATGNLEEAGSKEALVAGLQAAFDYCDRAYSELSPEQLAEEVTLFGMTGDRMWVLIFNAAHNWEHYGNLVTYLRLNGIVPPSSGGM